MKKPLKFSSKTHKFLWLGCLHRGHNPNWDSPPLFKQRGFSSIQEHDAWFIEQWYKLVDENTIVFNAGDAVFSDPRGEEFLRLTQLPCAAHYHINGNHLSGAKTVYQELIKELGLSDGMEAYPVKKNNLTFVGDNLHAFIDGQSVYMQHYAPYIWPEVSKGGWALVSHSHGNCKELNPENTTFGKIIEIGVDNAIKYNGTPFFTWSEIKQIMSKKQIRLSDHH